MADGARDLPGPRARAVGGLPRALPDAMETAAPGGDHPRVRVELMPIGGPNQTFTLGQNRLAAGVGLPLSSRVRTEIGYMNLYNAFTMRRANEINHTLWLSWHYTGAAR